MKFLIASVLIGSVAFTAAAVPTDLQVNVNGKLYDVTTTSTSFSADAAQLKAEPIWANPSLALQIATAVSSQLGTPNNVLNSGGQIIGQDGPLFAFADIFGTTTNATFVGTVGRDLDITFSDSLVETYAVVTPVPDGPSRVLDFAVGLPFLGLAFQRFIRQRCKIAIV